MEGKVKISINKLKKYYDDELILDIENLTFQKGKITGLLGSNGVGKSTLLNIIGGLDCEYSGIIKYDDKQLDKQIAKKMTMVFQSAYIFRNSVYENIEYPLKLRKIHKENRKQRVEKIIKSLEITDLKYKKGYQLSGGEAQKVSLARALVIEPEILLLDEPTSNIDMESIKIIEREIINFYKNIKGTVIIITHIIEQVNRLCDDIIYFEKEVTQ